MCSICSVAAISADLNPYEMSPLEQRELPQFAAHPGPYLEVRNHILKLWQQDVNSYVSPRLALKEMQVRLHFLLRIIRSFGTELTDSLYF